MSLYYLTFIIATLNELAVWFDSVAKVTAPVDGLTVISNWTCAPVATT